MPPKLSKTAWGRHLLYGAGLLALLLVLSTGLAWGQSNLVVDGGATKFVPPSISYDNETIGDTGQGTLTQFVGSNTVNTNLTLGNTATGRGTYKLFGGSLTVGNVEYIGYDGTGTFIQAGGSHSVTGLFFFGYHDGSSGTYQLKFGTLAVSGSELIGESGTGTFSQWGGSHTVAPDLRVGHGGSGTYQLYSGRLQVSSEEVIGEDGTGVFTQSGGQNTVAGALTLGAEIHSSSGTYNLKFGTLAVSGDEIIGDRGTGVFNQSGGQHTVAGNLILGNEGGSSGTYNLSGGQMSAGNIYINNMPLQGLGSGTFNVMNTITTVTGDVQNDGTVKTTNAIVTWNGTFTNNGAYISDHATQIFTDLTVPDPPKFTGYLVGHSQDTFKIKNDFNNMSANASAWDTAMATLQFITGADKSHNFYIAGADHGKTNNYTNSEFSWGTLNILGQTVRLLDGNTTNIGTAQYVKVLLGADVNYATRFVNNIFDDAGSPINIYYDPKALANLYLLGLDYTFAGGGMLIADASAPLPPSVFLLGSGLLGLGLLGWRRKRLKA